MGSGMNEWRGLSPRGKDTGGRNICYLLCLCVCIEIDTLRLAAVFSSLGREGRRDMIFIRGSAGERKRDAVSRGFQDEKDTVDGVVKVSSPHHYQQQEQEQEQDKSCLEKGKPSHTW